MKFQWFLNGIIALGHTLCAPQFKSLVYGSLRKGKENIQQINTTVLWMQQNNYNRCYKLGTHKMPILMHCGKDNNIQNAIEANLDWIELHFCQY